jgi:predicted hydrocarbon binding protein
MTNHAPDFDKFTDDNEQVTAFGYELIRSILIPELLGEESDRILYWAGKSLARRFPLTSVQETIDFFKKAAWGDLSISEENKREITFELTSKLISSRFQNKSGHSYQLEAGFLAEQIQHLKERISETYDTKKHEKQHKVIFKVQWDRKGAI